MIRSFLNFLLPDDEYKRTRIIYFLAEAAVLLTVILFIFSFFSSWLEWDIDSNTIHPIIVIGFISFYTLIRYIFSGIEFTDVSTKEQYVKQRRSNIIQASSVGFFFFIFHGIFEGFPSDFESAIDIVGPTLFFVFFYYLVIYLSLKRSYKKNRELLDD
ncbi:hypothetical protein [Oceanobacillus bengalensis]|uniref:DUF3278 domain-containing protein n=1 Tax=Oceanobacillus bengalensis TaxID=1435466 RepID=A0A494YZC3_9BACI|nr:hypothetical protein [Oceanobacillus bengalensis]RKQ15567.1 hypothetical protein D8M05_09865 [Oceanobacillus bengalensis]